MATDRKAPAVGRFRVGGSGHLQHKRRKYAPGDIIEMDVRLDRRLVETGRLVYVGPAAEAKAKGGEGAGSGAGGEGAGGNTEQPGGAVAAKPVANASGKPGPKGGAAS